MHTVNTLCEGLENPVIITMEKRSDQLLIHTTNKKLLDWMSSLDPFQEVNRTVSIASGVVDDKINFHIAGDVGIV